MAAGAWLAASSLAGPAAAFVAPPSAATSPPTAIYSAVERGGELLRAEEGAEQRLLDAAFSSLGRRDKYDAVLAGLCAKVVDGGAAAAREGLVDPLRLLEEMTACGVVAAPRGAIGLIDVRERAATRVSRPLSPRAPPCSVPSPPFPARRRP